MARPRPSGVGNQIGRRSFGIRESACRLLGAAIAESAYSCLRPCNKCNVQIGPLDRTLAPLDRTLGPRTLGPLGPFGPSDFLRPYLSFFHECAKSVCILGHDDFTDARDRGRQSRDRPRRMRVARLNLEIHVWTFANDVGGQTLERREC